MTAKNKLNNLMSWLLPVVMGLVIAWGIMYFIVSPVKVAGTSMFPNLQDKETLLLWHRAPVKRGSVVVFDAMGTDPDATKGDSIYIKRVIGLPGDQIKYDNGKLMINNKEVSQSYLKNSDEQVGGSGTSWDLKELSRMYNWSDKTGNTVPKGHYFVMGDHRSNSNDSRYWGFISADKVEGVAKVMPWSGSTAKHKENVNNFYKQLN